LHRGPKGRTKGRPSPNARRPARQVPIPPAACHAAARPHPGARPPRGVAYPGGGCEVL